MRGIALIERLGLLKLVVLLASRPAKDHRLVIGRKQVHNR